MAEREQEIRRRWEEILESFPRLTPQEERNSLRVSFGEQLLAPEDVDWKQISTSYPNIEITGMPRVGKTTLLSQLESRFQELQVPYHLIAERVVSFDKNASQLYHNLHIFLHVAEKLVALELGQQKKGPILIDRGIHNTLAFFDAYIATDEILREDADAFDKFVNYFYGGFVDAVIIFQSESDGILGRVSKHGRVVNEDFLPQLEKAFRNLPSKIVHLRETTLLRKEPLIIAEIDANQDFRSYSDLFIRTVGSVLWFFSQANVVRKQKG